MLNIINYYIIQMEMNKTTHERNFIQNYLDYHIEKNEFNHKNDLLVEQIKQDLKKVYCLGCPMSCSVKDIFNCYAKHGSSFGLTKRALPSATELLHKYCSKFDLLLYSYVLHEEIEKFAVRWKFLQNYFQL
jgi:hypothetical protein